MQQLQQIMNGKKMLCTELASALWVELQFLESFFVMGMVSYSGGEIHFAVISNLKTRIDWTKPKRRGMQLMRLWLISNLTREERC